MSNIFIYLFATDKSTSPPPFSLTPRQMMMQKKKGGVGKFFLPYMQCLQLIVHEPPRAKSEFRIFFMECQK